ncbi:hypothetical protein H8D76_01905 [Candidatus Bathyarchaeota archaeon]|nr:hypothetical protein [Candidatus Bathyarchaeota archaeon]
MRSNTVGKRRSKLEKNIDILTTIGKGESKPTRIMQATNMPWGQLQNNLKMLLERELVMVVDAYINHARYKTDKRCKYSFFLTPKGESVLRYLRMEAADFENLMLVMHASKSR